MPSADAELFLQNGAELRICQQQRCHQLWSGIEVVITGLTRNQLYLWVPWVRIPPAPPSKNEAVLPDVI